MRVWSFASGFACLGASVYLTASLSRAAEAPATPEQIAFFEKSIRPMLVKECFFEKSTRPIRQISPG